MLLGVRKFDSFLLGGTRAEKGWEPLIYTIKSMKNVIQLKQLTAFLLHIFKIDSLIMLLGGYVNGTGNNFVNLFNWLTLETCSLPDLPYIVSGIATTTGFGPPLFCGGTIPGTPMNRKTCYKFNTSTKGWTLVRIQFCFFHEVSFFIFFIWILFSFPWPKVWVKNLELTLLSFVSICHFLHSQNLYSATNIFSKASNLFLFLTQCLSLCSFFFF